MCRRYVYFSRFPAAREESSGSGSTMQPFTSVIDWSWPLSNRPILASAWRRVALLRVPSIKVTDPAAKVFSELPSAVTSSGGVQPSLVADAHINLNLCLGTDANNMRGEP